MLEEKRGTPASDWTLAYDSFVPEEDGRGGSGAGEETEVQGNVMQTVVGAPQVNAVGCEELGRMGLVDTSECCERCHYAESHASGLMAGLCYAALPDGRAAFVCCASKQHLLGRANS